MKLQKLGGDYHLVIETPEDLARISELEEAHWMATSAPCYSFTCDPAFLNFIDSDQNGRIRSGELIAAQRWLYQMLSDRSHLSERTEVLRLDCIDTSHDEGHSLRIAAERILTNLNKSDANEITLAEVRNRQYIVSGGTCNGDGIIPPESVDAPALAVFIKDIIRTVGGAVDAGGMTGIGDAQLKTFLNEAKDYVEWHRQGLIPKESDHTEIMTFGKATPALFEIVAKVRSKIEEYFDLCWLHGMSLESTVDSKSAGTLDPSPESDAHNRTDNVVEAKPLTVPAADEVLIIDDRINPAYRSDLIDFRDTVLPQFKKAGDKNALNRREWNLLHGRFAAYETWLSKKRGSKVERIAVDVLEGYIVGDLPEKLRDLISNDQAVAAELKKVGHIEKLILYQKRLLEFANNFVSFSHLFDPLTPSLIQMGTLIMDGRRFGLTMKVVDRPTHKKIVEESNICVMYLNVVRKNQDDIENMEIATAVTSGSMSRLFVGKAGVFFTPDKRQWDATVIDFVSNPVSLIEAIKKPFSQLGDFLRSQTERFSSARYKELEKSLGSSIQTAEQSLTSDSKSTPETNKKTGGDLRDLMVSGSVAFAALGSAFAFITKTLQSVSFFEMVSVVGGIALIVFAPVLIISMIKLYNRNLSVFLEACGWAINGQMRLSFAMGLLFTREPKPPAEIQLLNTDTIHRLLRQTNIKSRVWLLWLAGIAMLMIFVIFVLLRFFNM